MRCLDNNTISCSVVFLFFSSNPVCPLTCNLRWMVIRVQQWAEALGHLYLSWVGPQNMNVCVGGDRKKEDGVTRSRILGVNTFIGFWSGSPLSKALVVPFNTSRVRAAMMSACRAIAWARSTASAPREVIIWVPLIRARPWEGKTDICCLIVVKMLSCYHVPINSFKIPEKTQDAVSEPGW